MCLSAHPELCFVHRVELRALGNIKEGEEITVAYVDYLNLSHERKRLLKETYFFDCTCEHCNAGTNDDLKMAGKVVDGVKVRLYLLTSLQIISPCP